MKQLFLFVLSVMTIVAEAQFPGWTWANGTGGSGSDFVTSVTTDPLGNVYVTGSFNNSSITFGSITLTTSGAQDVFVTKYNSAGTVLWATKIGGTGSESSYAVKLDPNGSVYITGNFTSNSITIGSITLNSTGNNNFYVAKFSSSGSPLWAATANNSVGGASSGRDIALDTAGNLFVIGDFSGTSLSFGTTTLPNAGTGNEIFLAKYSSTGTPLWATSIAGTAQDFGSSIIVDTSGNVYATGRFQSPSVTLGTTTLTNAGAGTQDVVIARYSNTGSLSWATSIGAAGDELSSSINLRGGHVFVTGYFASSSLNIGSTTLTSAGGRDYFIAKYSISGSPDWATSGGGPADDQALSAAFDTSGNMYVTGGFGSSSMTIGSTTISNGGTSNTRDIYVVKYSPSGMSIWATSAGGAQHDDGRSVHVDVGGNVYLAGVFASSSVTIGTSTLSNLLSPNYDLFLAKIGNCSTPAPPQPSTVSGAANVCPGSLQTYSVAAVTGATSYNWTLPNGWTGTSTTNSINVTTGTTGGNITVAAVAGCAVSPVSTHTVTVSTVPTPTVTQSGFTLSTSAGQGSYQWYFNSSIIPGAITNTYTATQNGSYYVVVANSAGCTGQSNSITITNVKVKGPKKREVSIYPTYSNGRYSIELPDHKLPSSLNIYNIHGVKVEKLTSYPADGKLTIEITNKVPGMYYVEMVYPDVLFYQKVFIR